MVAYNLFPTARQRVVRGSAVLTTKWQHTWTPSIQVSVDTLPSSPLDAFAVDDSALVSAPLVGGGFLFGNGIKGTVESGAVLLGSLGPAFDAASDPVTSSEILVTGSFPVSAVVTDPLVVSDAEIKQTFLLIDEQAGDSPQVIATSAVTAVSLDIPTVDTRRSPPLALFDGTNLLARQSNDSTLNGSAEFTVAVLFDPELVEPGSDSVVVSKHNATDTQAGWKVEWDATTGEVTVTVCTSADGTTDLVERTTNVGTAADGTVGIRKREIVVFTYDETSPTLELYVEGSSSQGAQTDTGSPGTPNASTEPFAIAGDEPSNGGTNLFSGAVYLVAFWDVALSSTDVAKIDRTGQLHEDVVTGDLIAAWTSAQILSNQLTDRFYRWIDEVNDWDLYSVLSNDHIWIIPHIGTHPFVVRNAWDTDFFDTEEIRTENLNSNRSLSADSPNPLRRLYDIGDTNPNVADVDDWRTANGDLTMLIVGYKPAGTNDVLLFESYGLELRFDRPTQTVSLILGADNAGAGTPNDEVILTADATGLGENRAFTVVFRYNGDDEKATLFINGAKYLEQSRSGTNSFQDREGLELLDQADYIRAAAIPSCLSDAQVELLLTLYSTPVYSSDVIGPQRFRYVPARAEGLSAIPANYALREYNDQALPSQEYPRLATGELTLAGQPNDGDQFVIDDGFNPAVTFEFDSNSSVSPTATLRQVVIGGTVDGTLDNLSNAVNNAPTLDVSAQHVPQSDHVDLIATRGAYDGEGLFNDPITTPVNASGNLSALGFDGDDYEGSVIEWNSVPQRAMLLPSVIYSFDVAEWNYVDQPYSVQEPEDDESGGPGSVIFGDPLPSIVSVAVSTVGHNVTAIANAGPTDAGQVISYWEVELADGNTEVIAVADYNGNNSFSVNRNHTDTFQIPVGQNWRDRRIRFVIQAVLDGTQVWKSLFVRMEDAGFDNSETTTIIIPGTGADSPPTVEDLIVTVQQQDFALLQEEAAASVSVRVAEDSRYKLTKVFLDSDQDIGPEFDIMSVLTDFYQVGTDYRIHRVREVDIGFLDRLAVEFYGPGNENLWWVIAYANSVVDPEDLTVGESLIIPSRDRVRSFIARRPQRAQRR